MRTTHPTTANKRNSSASHCNNETANVVGHRTTGQQQRSNKTSSSDARADTAAAGQQQDDEAQGKKQHHQNQQQQRANDHEERRQQQQRQYQLRLNEMVAVASAAATAGGGGAGDEHRKQNHCEIEKRRRDKMNHYIMELASVIPSFNNNQGKFDKLTVLRMAVQHVKSLRSSLCSFSSFHLRPSFLSSGNLLKNLILQMASQEAQDNLFMVVSCDRGKVLFVSQSSKDILNQDQDELVGQCLFDILHKDDVTKVKEQISHFNMMPKEMLVDSKTFQPIKINQLQSFNALQNQQSSSTPQPGARRSFFCRMRSGRNVQPTQTVMNTKLSSSSSPTSSSMSSSSMSSSSSENLQAKQTSNDNNLEANCQPVSVLKEAIQCRKTLIKDGRRLAEVNVSLPTDHQASSSPSSSPSSSANSSPPLLLVNSNSFNHSKTATTKLCENITKTTNTNADSPSDDLRGTNLNINCYNDLTARVIKDGTTNVSGLTDCNGSNKNNGGRKSSNNKSRLKNRGSNSSSSCSSGDNSSSSGSSSGAKTHSGSSTTSSSSGIISGSQASEQSPSDNTSPSPASTKMGDIRRRSGSNGNKTKTSSTSSGGGSSTSTGARIGGGAKKHWRYIVMHCTGYLKAITVRNDEIDDDDFDDYNDDNNSSDDEENEGYRTVNCLVAVCRRSPMDRDLKPNRPLTFTCRYSMEGKFVFVDQRTTVALGYTPQQLLGTSHYAYCHKDSVNTFKECHRQSILKSEPVSSDIYQFKRENGSYMWLQTSLKSFRNPWTKFIDYIVANHTTAEGSDPHYNEGCVPTKFNQDMTCEGLQSTSPVSSSYLSLPSMDSKKSSSPSSSSIGSSYSMDSCASGASIQALLNQIDRVKSGGIKHALEFRKKQGDNSQVLIRSSDNAARKSNEDSVNNSDPQSCTSLSSQNSAQSSEYMNVPGINYFIDNTGNQASAASYNNTITNNSYYNQKVAQYRSTQNVCAPPSYQATSQQQQQQSQNQLHQQQQHQQQQQQMSNNNITNVHESTRFEAPSGQNRMEVQVNKPNSRLATGNIVRPQASTDKQHQRLYGDEYHYRSQNKSTSSTSSDTGNESATWSSSGSVYSNNPRLQTIDRETASTMCNQVATIIKDGRSSGVCGVQEQSTPCPTVDKLVPYANMQSVDSPSINMIPAQVAMQNQGNVIRTQVAETYSGNLMPVTSTTYINQDVDSPYNSGMKLNQVQQQQQQMNSDLQPNMTMTIQQHQTQMQRSQQQQTGNPNHINVPMIWNTTETPYQDLNNMHNTKARSICTSGDVTLMNMDVGNSNNQLLNQQQTVQCQQCAANQKCSIQTSMMTNNIDLNNINLTSLAVDGSLDEDQLLEYLAGCESESQIYHIQNNAFPQYNIYK